VTNSRFTDPERDNLPLSVPEKVVLLLCMYVNDGTVSVLNTRERMERNAVTVVG
jgi:hypothetical protein